jgi:hypothetical protein
MSLRCVERVCGVRALQIACRSIYLASEPAETVSPNFAKFEELVMGSNRSSESLSSGNPLSSTANLSPNWQRPSEGSVLELRI